jgi:hypothetical protein
MNNSAAERNSGGPFNARGSRAMHLLLKAAAWVGVGLTITALLAMVTFAMLLNSQRFHSYLLRTMQTKATAVLGVPVRLQDFVLHLSTLSIDLYGVTIDGASPYPNPPLLQVDHVEARVRVTSILRGTWNLETLRIDRPVVQIFFDTRGRSNIPTLKSGARSNSSIGMFDLAIGHASLTQGEVFYNNRPSALAVDLHDLTLHSSFDTLLGKYSGSLAYSMAPFGLVSIISTRNSPQRQQRSISSRVDLPSVLRSSFSRPCCMIIGILVCRPTTTLPSMAVRLPSCFAINCYPAGIFGLRALCYINRRKPFRDRHAGAER